MQENKKIIPRYPNFAPKAITFTIDDGNVDSDKIMLDILRPVGIKGTFNLTLPAFLSPEEYRELYQGYEIANHVAYHPFALDDSIEYSYVDVAPDSAEPSEEILYPVREGFYKKMLPRGWREVADTPTYIRCIDECRERLEEIFGEGSVGSFVWPYCEQNNREIKAHIAAEGYYAARKTGSVRDTTDFALPEDKMAWSYNIDDRGLLELMELYDACEDNGSLRFFAFGVHSIDFVEHGTVPDLRLFAEKYGNRSDEYFYATVGEIFSYADAMERLYTEGDTVYNPTDTTLYFEYDGGRYILEGGSHTEL